MPGRQYSGATGYRYGFGGQEKDDEISGSGNSYTAEFWQYDPRLGRRWNVDPVEKIGQSGYLCFSGDPISHTDKNGDDDVFDRNGNYLFSTKTGSLIKIVTPNGIQSLSQFTSEKGHSLPTAKIIDYYKVDAGFKKGDRVGVDPNSDPEKKTAYTNITGSYVSIKGGTKDNIDNSKNLTNVLRHEWKHKQEGRVLDFQDHLDVYSFQMDDASFKETTIEFKVTTAAAYGAYLLGGYEKQEFSQKEVEQKITDFNKKYAQYGISIEDNTQPGSQVGFTLQATGKRDNGNTVVAPIQAKEDVH